MGPVEYLRALQRRWKIIAATMLVALALGWVFSPEGITSTSSNGRFQATTHLIGSSTLSSGSTAIRATNLQTLAVLTTLGEVPRQVAEELGHEGDPSELTQNIQVDVDDTTGLLSIGATAPTAARARLVADTFAAELIRFLRGRNVKLLGSIESRINDLDQEIADLDAQIAQSDAPTQASAEEQSLSDERASLTLERQLLSQQYSQLSTSTAGSPSGLEIVEPAVASRAGAETGLLVPTSRGARLLIAGVVGLVLGMVIALFLERFDSRINSKDIAQDVLKHPVLGEIPVIPRRWRGSVVAAALPQSPAANAFRLVAATLQFSKPEHAATNESGNGRHGPQTILVTSAAPREGRSTIVANLAATFSDLGKRVIVVDCDLRHPMMHSAFGIEQSPGLSGALESGGVVKIHSLLHKTSLKDVRVLSSGDARDNTRGLFGSDRMREILSEVRAAADVVLIDTSPVLAASDWTQLLPEVDALVIVAQAEKTDRASAERTAAILAMLKAPVVGVVLNRIRRSLIPSAGYRLRFAYIADGHGSDPATKLLEPAAAVAHDLAPTNGGDVEVKHWHVASVLPPPPVSKRSVTSYGGIPPLRRHSIEE